MNWEKIDNAPKTGESFLAFSDEGVYECRWNDGRFRALTLDEHGCGCCGGDNAVATHWMPLPAPPATEGEA